MTGLPIFTVGQYSRNEIPNRSNRSAPKHEAVQMGPQQRQATAILHQAGV